MSTGRNRGVAALLLLVGGPALAACQAPASGAVAEDAIAAAASVEPSPDGGPALLHLTEESVLRLGLETAPVDGSSGVLTVPYAAVVYDADGASWVFVEVEDRVYQRSPITISAIQGDAVGLAGGPAPGTEVVTVAAAELVGVEAGISGGE
jgi:hypothetical protein